MAGKAIVDFGTIAGGGFISYASIIGEVESWLGFILIIFTLILTTVRILIAIREWKSRKD